MPARRPKQPNANQLEAQCIVWNHHHAVGCTVWYHPIIGEPECFRYTTRTGASVLSGHTAVVWLNDKAGCVALDALTDKGESDAATK